MKVKQQTCFMTVFVLNKLTKFCCFMRSGNRQQQQQFGSDREGSYSLLEAQHAELKRKVRLKQLQLRSAGSRHVAFRNLLESQS